MKIKILLVPFIIIITAIFGIWVVYPAFSNGADGVKDKYNQLNEEQLKLEGVRGKGGNVDKLASQISSLSSDADVLSGFIPKEAKNENIIDSLNYLASASGLAVYEISIEDTRKGAGLSLSNIESETPGIAEDALPKIQEFKTDVRIEGNYEQIKNFLNGVNKLSRYNSVSLISIKKNQALDNLEGSTDLLKVDMKIKFGVLAEAVLSDNIANDPIFSGNKLNTEVVTEIKNKKTNNILQLNLDQQGKSNIFMP